eukprot:CAMPEP_0173096208 /NCGR_PEP_ID=MMETSP1102-20130122/32678_1 /TAXON_ID=49646 /ORGANISM="Geminigera sp., Strain Caron Lab Isolate" /LENGTH=146 /DNA_ID=CAMNT_0013986829 /DNA_START=25 /DNA_END=461 /DNA_ORIENTATION=+
MGLQFSMESSTAVREGENVRVERSTWSSGTSQSSTSNQRIMKSGEHVLMEQQTWSNAGGISKSSASSARSGPGGVSHLQSQVIDGRGQEKLLNERRIGDMARREEKIVDRRTGEEESYDESVGIADGRQESFDLDFQRRMAGGGRP